MRLRRSLLLIALAIGASAVSPSHARALDLPALVQAKPIGSPTGKPLDFHQFSAAIGTASDGYAEFTTTQLAILPAPHHRLYRLLGVGPGAPHQPPYDHDEARGVAAQQYHQGPLFTRPAFSAGNGVPSSPPRPLGHDAAACLAGETARRVVSCGCWRSSGLQRRTARN